jgi:uncharacterized protein YjbI with pentapeptide repeats
MGQGKSKRDVSTCAMKCSMRYRENRQNGQIASFRSPVTGSSCLQITGTAASGEAAASADEVKKLSPEELYFELARKSNCKQSVLANSLLKVATGKQYQVRRLHAKFKKLSLGDVDCRWERASEPTDAFVFAGADAFNKDVFKRAFLDELEFGVNKKVGSDALRIH